MDENELSSLIEMIDNVEQQEIIKHLELMSVDGKLYAIEDIEYEDFGVTRITRLYD